MSVIYLVIPLAVILAAVAVAGFLWATRRGQFDDLKTPAIRALHDDSERTRENDAPPGSTPTS